MGAEQYRRMGGRVQAGPSCSRRRRLDWRYVRFTALLITVWGNTLDAFPFVGEMPSQPGNFVAAGFNGHGMPRILLTTAHLAPLVLDNLGIRHSKPKMLDQAPPLPKPFILTQKRIDELHKVDVKEWQAARDRAAARGSQLAECQKYKHMTTEMDPVDLAVAKM